VLTVQTESDQDVEEMIAVATAGYPAR